MRCTAACYTTSKSCGKVLLACRSACSQPSWARPQLQMCRGCSNRICQLCDTGDVKRGSGGRTYSSDRKVSVHSPIAKGGEQVRSLADRRTTSRSSSCSVTDEMNAAMSKKAEWTPEMEMRLNGCWYHRFLMTPILRRNVASEGTASAADMLVFVLKH